jgi:hypothetical protein
MNHIMGDKRLGGMAIRCSEFVPKLYNYCEHTIVPIELSACGLSIDATAGHDRRKFRVRALSPHEDVANLVDGHREAGLLRPGYNPVSTLLVQVRQPKGSGANIWCGGDFSNK